MVSPIKSLGQEKGTKQQIRSLTIETRQHQQNNRINSDWLFRCATLTSGYVERSALIEETLKLFLSIFYLDYKNDIDTFKGKKVNF